MIDIEQDALRALEQNAAAALKGRIEIAPDRTGEGQNEIGDFPEIVKQPLSVYRRLVEAGTKRIVMRTQPIEHRSEIVELGEVANADCASADLVLIGGADAAAGGTDL